MTPIPSGIDVVRMPTVVAVSDTGKRLGMLTKIPHSDRIATRHHEIVKAASQNKLEAKPDGYSKVISQPEWRLDPNGESDWVIAPLREDLTWQQGQFSVPGKILRNIKKARNLNLFDDLYVAHQLPHDPSRTATSVIPWAETKPALPRKIAEIINNSTTVDKALANGFKNLNAAFMGGLLLVVGVAVSIAIALATLAAVAAVVMVVIGALVALAASAGVILLIGLVLSGIATGDPVVYGIIYNENYTYGKVFILGQWDH